MYTLHHGFWVYFFTRKRADVWQFVVGSMLPDYVYVAMLIVMIMQGKLHWSEVMDVGPLMMMSFIPQYPWVTQLDLLGHSAVVWAAAFVLTMLPQVKRFQAFVIGWGTHVLVDFLTHSTYSNFYLYPLSMAGVHSPVSYWQAHYFGREFKMVNGIFMTLAVIYIIYQWWQKKQKK